MTDDTVVAYSRAYSSSARRITSVNVSPCSTALAFAASRRSAGMRTVRCGVVWRSAMSATDRSGDGGDLFVGPVGVAGAQPCRRIVCGSSGCDFRIRHVGGDFAGERACGLSAGFVFLRRHGGGSRLVYVHRTDGVCPRQGGRMNLIEIFEGPDAKGVHCHECGYAPAAMVGTEAEAHQAAARHLEEFHP